MKDKKSTKRCWHFPQAWQPLAAHERDKHTTSAMYRAGVAPTHIRSCKCGQFIELQVGKWEDQ